MRPLALGIKLPDREAFSGFRSRYTIRLHSASLRHECTCTREREVRKLSQLPSIFSFAGSLMGHVKGTCRASARGQR